MQIEKFAVDHLRYYLLSFVKQVLTLKCQVAIMAMENLYYLMQL